MLNCIFFFMLIVFAIFVICSIVNGSRLKKYIKSSNSIEYPKFLEKSVTDTIRGIASIMIVLSHIVQQLGDRLSISVCVAKYIKIIVFNWGG